MSISPHRQEGLASRKRTKRRSWKRGRSKKKVREYEAQLHIEARFERRAQKFDKPLAPSQRRKGYPKSDFTLRITP